jgi:hypothetical protein
MVDSRWLAHGVSEYQQLSSWEKAALKRWIAESVDSAMLWCYTSLGLCTLFMQSVQGFRVTHAQMQQAMLLAGYTPLDSREDVWVFHDPDGWCCDEDECL